MLKFWAKMKIIILIKNYRGSIWKNLGCFLFQHLVTLTLSKMWHW